MPYQNENHASSEPIDPEEPKTPFEKFLFHQRRAMEETGKALEALLPEGFKEHGAEASREFIKGFRVLVDAAITEIEKAVEEEDDEDKPSTTGKTKVKVEVD
ncbi:MAG: hypothetical protein H6672_18795 [Anaerolineaceae bacterium]|nr:hypothetical protein [Anaerolineaceae bacterium]